jgi:pimeloyl-[acyl-carrier protein] methyl ester esterase
MSSNPSICWLHGWGVTKHVWNSIVAQWPQAFHAYVDYSKCKTLDELRQSVENVLHLREDRWIMVGWSMGGMLALEQAFAQHVRIQKVIIVSATLKFVHEDRSLGWPHRVLEKMQKQLYIDSNQVLSQFFERMVQTSSATTYEYVLQQNKIHNQLESLHVGLQYLRDTDLTPAWNFSRQHMKSNRVPIYWVHGTHDEICPAKAVPQHLTEDEIVWIEGAGHALMITHPHQLAEIIEKWIFTHELSHD